MLKLAILVTVFCIAHAYVAINIYDTDVDTSRDSKPFLGSCFPLECDQLCRRTTFHSGACVNGRCKCDILKNVGDLQSCNLRWCEQTCRHMGFPGGVCVDERCKCDILNRVEDLQSCNLRWCEQTCRNMGFPGGVCVDDRCKCDILNIVKALT